MSAAVIHNRRPRRMASAASARPTGRRQRMSAASAKREQARVPLLVAFKARPDAERDGLIKMIGQDAVQEIISKAFGVVR
jgi:hypothetical protein